MSDAFTTIDPTKISDLARRPKRNLLLGASGLAIAVVLTAPPANALNECGAAVTGGTVTCTPAGNNFPGGIEYKVNDLTIVVEDGVVIDTTGKAGEPGGIVSGLTNKDYGNLTIKVGTASGAGVTITTDDQNASGIAARSDSGDIAITSFADVSTTGDNAFGIFADSDIKSATVNSTGDISTSGVGSRGIAAHGKVSATLVSNGDISTTAANSEGLAAYNDTGGTTVSITSTGDITTKGINSTGIFVLSQGDAAIVSLGDVSTEGGTALGVDGYASGTVTVTSTGDISTKGTLSYGLRALSKTDAATATTTGDLTTRGDFAIAITITAEDNATLTSKGDISTAGKSASAIEVTSKIATATVTSTGDITTTGYSAGGILAHGKQSASVTSHGDIVTSQAGSRAIAAYNDNGGTTVTVDSTGNISTAGVNAAGILAVSRGAATVTSVGNISTTSGGARAMDAYGKTSVSVTSTGNVSTTGDLAGGLLVLSTTGTADLTATGKVSTEGDNAEAVHVSGAAVIIISKGDVTTAGTGSEAIEASSTTGNTTVGFDGAIVTAGLGADGIQAESKDGGVAVVAHGSIRTSGNQADAVLANGKGDVTIQVGDAIATGKDSAGIFADSQNGKVSIIVTGAVQGGTGSQGGNGIVIGAAKDSIITIDEGGSVGALSDVAIVAAADAKTSIFNDGAITGSVFFGGKDDLLSNGGVVELRALADGQTEGVALAAFGVGNDTFSNFGTLSLGNADGASDVNISGQFTTNPAGGDSDITQKGVEQGHITGLELFENFGLITMQDGTAGDLIAITSGSQAAPLAAADPNEFRSEGGALALDVVLDDGSSKQSDMLVLQNATTGAGGATRVLIANAGGAGGQTSGDGIQIVNISGKSTADAFAAGNHPVAGAFQYDLFFQNADKTDQNWYLRSTPFQGAVEYPAIQSGALEVWYSDLGALGDELRKRRTQVEAQDGQTAELPTATDIADTSSVRVSDAGPGSGRGGWFRVSGSDMDIEQDGTDPDFNLNTTRAEAGFDVGFNDLFGEDWLVAGGFAGYGWSGIGFGSGSKLDFNIATVGAYATYFRGPYYLDALVKFDWLDGDFNSEAVTTDGDVDLPAIGFSLETGYRFDLTSREDGGGLYIQPQAQLSFAHVGSDSFKDDSGATIELGDTDSLKGRVGARLGQELTSGPAKGNFYLEASVNQEFLGETEAKVTGVTLQQDLPGTTYEVGAGFDIALPKDGVSFTIDADYTLGDEADGIAATGGIRINW